MTITSSTVFKYLQFPLRDGHIAINTTQYVIVQLYTRFYLI